MGVSQGCLLSPIINYLIQYIHFRSSYMMTYVFVKFKENPCVGTFVTPPFAIIGDDSALTDVESSSEALVSEGL